MVRIYGIQAMGLERITILNASCGGACYKGYAFGPRTRFVVLVPNHVRCEPGILCKYLSYYTKTNSPCKSLFKAFLCL